MVTAAVVMLLLIIVTVKAPLSAFAAGPTPVNLGAAGTFSVLAGDTVTNTGGSILDRSLGVSPGSEITGFPPGVVRPPGVKYTAADPEPAAAQGSLGTAYLDAEGRRGATPLDDEHLGGRTLVGGVYKANSSAELTGNLTLNGDGESDSVWIFQIPSSLTTASHSNISLTNGALACNVFWQVGSSATIKTDTHFIGTVMALGSITAQTNAFIDGRLLARSAGAVTLDTNVFQSSACGAEPAPTVTVTGPATTVTATPTATETVTGPTSTVTGPTVTETAAGPTTTETATATATSTVTETVGSGTPTATETVTETAAGPTTTVTGPTTTVTGPTTTVTGPTTTVTGPTTGPTTTVTETGPATATATVTETGPATATVTETETETGPATATETVTETQEAETEEGTATATETETEQETVTKTKTETTTETETESSNGSSRTYLADTGASAGTNVVAIGGVVMLLLGGLSLLIARRRARTQGRHE